MGIDGGWGGGGEEGEGKRGGMSGI